MSSPFDFGILLGLAYQAFTDELRADLAARGFTDLGSAYGYVFRALADDTLRLSDLAKQLGMSNQGAAKIIDEMHARGYVTRGPDPDDGRAKSLLLAPRGRAALAAARRFHAKYERELRAMSREGDVDVLREQLERIVTNAGMEGAALRAL